MTRVFDASRELVFRAWTDRVHLMHWSAPHGFTVTHSEGDLRPGGRWRACMRSPEGTEYWLGGVYREITSPERLVFTHAWEEPKGTPGHETLVTITLVAQRGKTKLTFHQTGFASVEARDGHRGGWSESFERLADCVARMKEEHNGRE
ncbi:MAG TPA: SRPBCC domain-containing protein [Candidatus Krumholzibacteria bacterium]|nr:SRPBCC domain-containing protein [Candidatus Krumholzibacteria bacterium]